MTDIVTASQTNSPGVDMASRRKSMLFPIISLENSENIQLIESSRRDIQISKFVVKNVISGVEDSVVKKEEQRDYKMKSKFFFVFKFFF